MNYDFSRADHLAAYLRSLPRQQVEGHAKRFLRDKDEDFREEVRHHFKNRTPVEPVKTVEARARNTDPATSHIRAEYLNRSKLLNRTQEAVIRALEALGPSNSKTVALWIKEHLPGYEGEWANISPVFRPMERDLGLLVEMEKVDNKIVWDIHRDAQGKLL